MQQLVLADRVQRQGHGLLQAAQQVEQFELAEVAAAGMQGQAGAAVDDAVAMAPGEQLHQLATALDRREVFPLQGRQVAVVQAPVGLSGLLAIRRLHQGQGVFGQVRGDARVDEFDFPGLAFEGRVQAPSQHVQVTLVDQAGGLFGAGELGQEAIAVVQFVDQRAPLGADLAHLPLAAAVEQGQLALIPPPFLGQALQQRPLPVRAAGAVAGRQLAVDLEIQAATYQFQALGFAAGLEVFLDTPVDHDVGVQLVQVQAVGEHRLLEAQAQALDPWVLAGVDLDQQQLEHRLVGRLDALEQLPEPRADELPRRNARHVPQVEVFLGGHEALGQQRMDVLLVARLLVHRHQPPERRTSGEPDGGAIELVQQQVVLRGAAVVRAQSGIAFAAHEAAWVDEEEMRFGALAFGPGLQQLALLLQFGQFVLVQVRGMADPDVHVALVGLGQGAQAAHQEQSMDRSRRVAVAGLVGKGASQALGFGQYLGIGFVVGQARRRRPGDVAGQQRVIDVEEQRQQVEDQLLARRQPLHRPGHASFVEGQKARAKLTENLAVDSFIQVGTDFMGMGHFKRSSNVARFRVGAVYRQTG